MSEAATLRAALQELLEKCQGEFDEWLANNPSPASDSVEAQLQYLKEAQTALTRIAHTADSETCARSAREVLIAVARFRNALAASRADKGHNV
jgi:uncharacterized membrane protein